MQKQRSRFDALNPIANDGFIIGFDIFQLAINPMGKIWSTCIKVQNVEQVSYVASRSAEHFQKKID